MGVLHICILAMLYIAKFLAYGQGTVMVGYICTCRWFNPSFHPSAKNSGMIAFLQVFFIFVCQNVCQGLLYYDMCYYLYGLYRLIFVLKTSFSDLLSDTMSSQLQDQNAIKVRRVYFNFVRSRPHGVIIMS